MGSEKGWPGSYSVTIYNIQAAHQGRFTHAQICWMDSLLKFPLKVDLEGSTD